MRTEALIKAQNKYRSENREEINKKKLEKIECPICNCDVSRSAIKRHERSEKHLRKVNGDVPIFKVKVYDSKDNLVNKYMCRKMKECKTITDRLEGGLTYKIKNI